MITIYGKPVCGFCTKAKTLADQYNVEYNYVDLTQNPDKLDMIKQQGHKTVPVIFKEDKMIGGYEDFYKYIMEV